ncbi:MAG TPA: hypothetical protein VND64_37585 [Pirellulales bacterium]|nr:hypothetical protein [Pirellulales bacterium]
MQKLADAEAAHEKVQQRTRDLQAQKEEFLEKLGELPPDEMHEAVIGFKALMDGKEITKAQYRLVQQVRFLESLGEALDEYEKLHPEIMTGELSATTAVPGDRLADGAAPTKAVKKLLAWRNEALKKRKAEALERIVPLRIPTPAQQELASAREELATLEKAQAKLEEARKKRPNAMTSKKREEERKAKIEDLHAQIPKLETAAVAEETEERERHAVDVARVTAEIAALEDDLAFMPAPPFDVIHLEVGMIGTLPRIVVIANRRSPKDAGGLWPAEGRAVEAWAAQLANGGTFGTETERFLRQFGEMTQFDGSSNAKVVQVMDKTNVLVMPNVIGSDRSQVFWLEGVPTDGKFDNSWFKYEKTLEVVATKQYQAAGGAAKTFFLLKPFDSKVLAPYLGSDE